MHTNPVSLTANKSLTTYNIIGDVGGHLDMFHTFLRESGVDINEGVVPASVRVIQVGDLVHKGPESERCVALADRLLANNHGSYVQLIGNHEAHYLGGPSVSGRAGVRPISMSAQRTLHQWWDTGALQFAVCVPSAEYGNILVTHGGLTAGMWNELDRPETAQEAADRLNALMSDPVLPFRPGALMTGVVDFSTGVLCPRTGAELAASWIREGTMPFTQVHGHEGVWHWPTNQFHSDVPNVVRELTVRNEQRRWCSVTVGDYELISIDCVLGETVPTGDYTWAPFTTVGDCGSLR